MPLVQSPSNAARSENIRREIIAGKPRAQAAAIGYSVQRANKGKKPPQSYADKLAQMAKVK